MSATETKEARGHCPTCGPGKRAIVRGHHRSYLNDEERDIWVATNYRILECGGCDAIYFQTNTSSSEDQEEDINHWPMPQKRRRPDWAKSWWNSRVDRSLVALMDEVYSALDHDMRVAAATGMRTVLERAMTLLDIPDEAFTKRLDALLAGHHIGNSQHDSLAALTEAGHAAAHRGWIPSSEHLNTMMNVLEPFLHHAFVVRDEALRLRSDVPSRHGPVKPSSFDW